VIRAPDEIALRRHASTALGTVLATILSGVLLLVCVLVWPGFLERRLSLEWRLGNIRPALHVLQAVLAGAALLTGLFRRSIGARFALLFPSPRAFVLVLLASTFGLVAALGALEMACRLLDLPGRFRVPPPGDVAATFDDELGWAYLPNHAVTSSFGSDERKITSYFDGIGARVRGPDAKHDRRAPTVLLVGGSFTMGHGVAFDDTFAGRLERMPGFPYQVVDLGVQGFGTDQSLLMLERNFKRFDTKVVVYTFIEDHIVRNSNFDRRVLQMNANTPGTKPLFGLDPDGTLHLRKTPYRLTEHPDVPRLWRYLEIAWNRVGPRPSVPLTVALVKEMRRFTEANGAAFLLVYWRGQEARPTPRMSLFDSLGLEMLDTGVDAPAGWPSWTLAGDPHPDARAHARVAALLYDAIMDVADGASRFPRAGESIPAGARVRPTAGRASPAPSAGSPAG